MNILEIYASYSRSVHVVIMCVSALAGPIFLKVGFDAGYEKEFFLGAIFVCFFLYNIVKTFLQKQTVGITDRAAFFWIPLAFVPLGMILLFYGDKALG